MYIVYIYVYSNLIALSYSFLLVKARFQKAAPTAGLRKAGSAHRELCNHRPNGEGCRHHQISNQEVHFGADASDTAQGLHGIKQTFK